MPLNLDEYQRHAMLTALYPGHGTTTGLNYTALKLCGEAGEIAEKVGKSIRGDFSLSDPAIKESIAKEIGDVLWYCAACAHNLGLPLSDIATANLAKLASRQQRGVIQGSGDDR